MNKLSGSLIKQGWLRAVLYFLCLVVVAFFIKSYILVAAVALVITYVARVYLDRQSFISLGFYFKGFDNEAALGLFTAIALLGIGTISLTALDYLNWIGVSFSQVILIEVGSLLVVAFIEELVFRGYLLNNLMQSMNKWIALLATALLFALTHSANPNADILPVLNVFAAGILLGINYIYTKNLWFSMCFHFAWNYMQGPILGYEVSGLEITSLLQQSMEGPTIFTGGMFGFEGSLICLTLLIISSALYAILFAKRYATLPAKID